jgi:hypothetical protein
MYRGKEELPLLDISRMFLSHRHIDNKSNFCCSAALPDIITSRCLLRIRELMDDSVHRTPYKMLKRIWQ